MNVAFGFDDNFLDSHRASDRDRTDDSLLGRQTLYQLSYARKTSLRSNFFLNLRCHLLASRAIISPRW